MDLWSGDFISDTLADELITAGDGENGSAKKWVTCIFQLLPTIIFATIGEETIQFNHAGVDPALVGASYGKPKLHAGVTTVPIKWGKRQNVLAAFLSQKTDTILALSCRNSTRNGDTSLSAPDDSANFKYSARDRSQATDYNLNKWLDFLETRGVESAAVLDPENGRWSIGRNEVMEYQKRSGVTKVVGGHQDLTHVGILSSNHSGNNNVFDMFVPVLRKREQETAADYLAIKTSIAWESKPGDFAASCFLCLRESSSF